MILEKKTSLLLVCVFSLLFWPCFLSSFCFSFVILVRSCFFSSPSSSHERHPSPSLDQMRNCWLNPCHPCEDCSLIREMRWRKKRVGGRYEGRGRYIESRESLMTSCLHAFLSLHLLIFLFRRRKWHFVDFDPFPASSMRMFAYTSLWMYLLCVRAWCKNEVKRKYPTDFPFSYSLLPSYLSDMRSNSLTGRWRWWWWSFSSKMKKFSHSPFPSLPFPSPSSSSSRLTSPSISMKDVLLVFLDFLLNPRRLFFVIVITMMIKDLPEAYLSTTTALLLRIECLSLRFFSLQDLS